MRAGRLRHRITIWERIGEPPIWQVYRNLWAAIEPPKTKGASIQDIGIQGMRRPLPYLIRTRANPHLRAGLLVQFRETSNTIRYFSVDTVADQNERGNEFVTVCREFVGTSALYEKANGTQYNILANPVVYSTEMMYPSRLESRTVDLEVLMFDLSWPWGQRNDRIIMPGNMEYVIDGTPDRGDDGYTVIFHTLHRVPDQAMTL